MKTAISLSTVLVSIFASACGTSSDGEGAGPSSPAGPETPGTPDTPGTPGTPGTPDTPVTPVANKRVVRDYVERLSEFDNEWTERIYRYDATGKVAAYEYLNDQSDSITAAFSYDANKRIVGVMSTENGSYMRVGTWQYQTNATQPFRYSVWGGTDVRYGQVTDVFQSDNELQTRSAFFSSATPRQFEVADSKLMLNEAGQVIGAQRADRHYRLPPPPNGQQVTEVYLAAAAASPTLVSIDDNSLQDTMRTEWSGGQLTRTLSLYGNGDLSSSVDYTYDAQGRVISAKRQIGDYPPSLSQFTYDADGYVISIRTESPGYSSTETIEYEEGESNCDVVLGIDMTLDLGVRGLWLAPNPKEFEAIRFR